MSKRIEKAAAQDPFQKSFPLDGHTRNLRSSPISAAEFVADQIFRRDKLWPNASRKALFVDWYSGTCEVFSPKTLEVFPQTDTDNPKYRVCIISSPQVTLTDEDFQASFIYYVTSLTKKGVLYFIEDKPLNMQMTKADIEQRLNFMSDYGLVDRHVSTSHPQFLIWRAHIPVEHIARTINIPETWKNSDTWWKRTYFHGKAKDLYKMFWRNGYKITNWDKIKARLSASRFVPRDIQFFCEGQGIEYTTEQCGCIWERLLDSGNDVRIHTCGIPGCDGIAPVDVQILRTLKLFYPDQKIQTTRPCMDCQNKYFIQTCEVLGSVGYGKTKVRITNTCPSCEARFSDKKIILNEQLRYPS